jgi:outer membrane protein assembly factor BamE
MFRPTVRFAALAAAAVLPGCGAPSIPGITPYRMEIQQGNFVSQEMVSRLRKGMSKDEVRVILGTPLITDVFHADRWDYIFWREAADGTREQRKLAVYFEGDKLARVEGDVVAADGAKETAK